MSGIMATSLARTPLEPTTQNLFGGCGGGLFTHSVVTHNLRGFDKMYFCVNICWVR